ncbi:hypothetical protein G9P44_004207 [Scheffersomyces stipitis]|nr:hypothetical protein G9P44_004207 [Scheffersomyces stipitis]
MLRRPATTIKLTPEDILEYDDSLAQQQQPQVQQNTSFSHEQLLQEQINNSTNEIVPPYKPTEQQPTRDDRIGVNQNNN